MFIAIDGNSTGKIIEKMILDNELEKLARFSSELQLVIQSISDYIIRNAGVIIMSGGDNILAEIPPDTYKAILKAANLLSVENLRFSVSLSTSVQGAYLGLKYAKAANICIVKADCSDNGTMSFTEIAN